VEWDNLCHEVQGLPVEEEADVVPSSLDSSGRYSTSSMYMCLLQGATITLFRDVWKTRVPPKIKIFLWQLIRGRLPSCEQVAKCMGPSNGLCALCADIEDCNHIFFTCPLACFMWARARGVLHCDWNLARAGEFLPIVEGLSGPFRRLV
jgi:hypothetical protein